jgi:methyl coenzyme M reductase subunit C-like uncharacterized protein (methanogenesis marker protein 7)
MKIDTRERLEEAVALGKSFEQQLAEAKASGRAFGTVVDMKLGQHVIYHTAEEIAEYQTRADAETQARNADISRKAAMTVEHKLAAAGLTVADIKEAVRK